MFREHDSGPGHPERPERVGFVRRGIEEGGLSGRLTVRVPRPATEGELRRVHSADHVAAVAGTAGRTVRFDADTQAGPRSYEAALHAAGAVVDAVDDLIGGALDGAFCLSRPPGHHAESDRAMGFCLFNNVAVGAAHALARGIARVLVIDFDVHHGNGTEEIFAKDPRVLYVSSHAYPFYPGTGAITDVGTGEGRGFTVNLPLPEGCGDAEYGRVYGEIVRPLARAFHPELVLVSAGFDAWGGDPLAGMRLTAAGYQELAAVCVEAAAGPAARGRVAFALEGGYAEEGLGAGGAAVASALLERLPPRGGWRTPPAVDALVAAFRRAHASAWPILAG